MQEVCLALDIGTTNVKAALVTDTGEMLAVARRECRLRSERAGFAEQFPEDWWAAVCSVTRQVAEECRSTARIVAAGLSGQMHGAVLLDEAGRPLRLAIVWADSRSQEECGSIERLVGGDVLAASTGSRVFPGATLPLLSWLKRHEPQTLARARWVVCAKDYVRFRMTGRIATDPVDASGTLMFLLEEDAWATGILETLGLDPRVLPPVVRSSDVVGRVTPEASWELGIPEVPVVAGAGDQGTGALGNGLIADGIVGITVGTGGQVLAASSRPFRDTGGRVQTLRHAWPGWWLVMGATLSAGLSLRWLRDTLTAAGQPGGAAAGQFYQAMDEKADGIEPGCDGLFFLPYLTGERCPYFDPLVRGAFVGLDLHHRPEHLARAVMEGVAYSLRQCLDVMRTVGLPAREFRLSGGGAASRTWGQIFADVLGAPVSLMPTVDSTLRGAGALAFIAAGRFEHPAGAVASMVQPGCTVTPRSRGMDAYAAGYERFKRLYGLLDPHYHPESAAPARDPSVDVEGNDTL